MGSLLLWPLAVAALAAAPIPFEGRVLTSTGRPVTQGVVVLEHVADHPLNLLGAVRPTASVGSFVMVGPLGRFRTELPEPGAYRVWFMAPGHSPHCVVVIAPEENARIDPMTVTLGHSRPLEWVGTPSVVFGGSDMKRAAAAMTRADDGPWVYSEDRASEILYALELPTKGTPEWVLNPSSERSRFIHGRFLSVAAPKLGKATIRFDPGSFRHEGAKVGSVAFEDPSSVHARVAAVAGDYLGALGEAWRAADALPTSREERWARFVETGLYPASEAAIARYKDEREPRLAREVAAVAGMSGLRDLTPDLSKQIAADVPATSWAWSLNPTYPSRFATSEDWRSYIETGAENHPDRRVRGQALLVLATRAEAAQQSEEAARLLRRASADYSDVRAVKRHFDRARKKRVRSAGAEFPDLKLATLDGRPVDAAALRGRHTLVEFSSPYCGPCVDLIPQLAKVREAYAEAALRMITITVHADESKLRETLKHQPPQPWEHVALPDSEEVNRALTEWEVWWYPTLFLVGPNGRIVAVDEQLRADNDAVKGMKTFLPPSEVRAIPP